jgi:hypothetical protein
MGSGRLLIPHGVDILPSIGTSWHFFSWCVQRGRLSVSALRGENDFQACLDRLADKQIFIRPTGNPTKIL